MASETWTVRLGYAGGHGQWGGRDPFEGMTAQAVAPGQRVAVLTRAAIRPRRLVRFYRAVPAVDQALARRGRMPARRGHRRVAARPAGDVQPVAGHWCGARLRVRTGARTRR